MPKTPIKIIRGWALIDWPDGFPYFYRTRIEAEEESASEEQLYRVEVHVLKRVTKRQLADDWAEREPFAEDVE